MADKELVARLFDELMVQLPEVLCKKDHHGILRALEEEGLLPYSPVTQQHLLCEYRKARVPKGRPRRNSTNATSDPDYLIAYANAKPAFRKAPWAGFCKDQ